jgi:two-component system phosphate regulon sensor histidine kinase PhoR
MRSIRRTTFWSPVLLVALTLALVDGAAFLFLRDRFLVVALLSLAALPAAIAYAYISSTMIVKPLTSLAPRADAAGRLQLQADAKDIPIELQELQSVLHRLAEEQDLERETRLKLERVRSEFLGNVSHELRTPIFAIQGFIETLLDGAVDDASVNRDFLERARAQADRLNSLLNDLIDISRIESGEMRMSFRSMDIQAFLRDFTQEMHPLAAKKQIELYFAGNVLPHHEVLVYADRDRIKQVMVNLVDNAIKYSEPNTSIKIELVNESPNARMATVRVVDAGVGIADEYIPRLFERFFRVDKGRARSSPGGTGLGLAIVKHIIEAHKGRLTVTSQLGKGSTFQFTLHKEPF